MKKNFFVIILVVRKSTIWHSLVLAKLSKPWPPYKKFNSPFASKFFTNYPSSIWAKLNEMTFFWKFFFLKIFDFLLKTPGPLFPQKYRVWGNALILLFPSPFLFQKSSHQNSFHSCAQLTDTGLQNLTQGLDQLKSLQTLDLSFSGYQMLTKIFLFIS